MPNLTHIIDMIKPLDKEAMAEARSRQDTLTKPQGSLGRLEELSIQLAGDHGVMAEKVGNWPQEVTAQMVYNFLRGGAGINVLAHQIGARIVVVDMGVTTNLKPDPQLVSRKIGFGTQNMCVGPAMTTEQAIKAIETGIEIIADETAKGLDVVGTGDMGIGNTTSSSAIIADMTGKPVAEVTGRGTVLTDEQLTHKIEVINKAITVNSPDPTLPLDMLSRVGGFEIGGLVGVMLAAARVLAEMSAFGEAGVSEGDNSVK